MRQLTNDYMEPFHCKILENTTSIPSRSVDFVYALYVLQHVSADLLDSVVSDFFRILKPGGKIFVINNKKRVVAIYND
jgi:predicted SAM-dependent methyltransferase